MVMVPVDSEVSMSALLYGVARPSNLQSLKVMLAPVTLTNPLKSLPLKVCPLALELYVWSPVTTARTTPGVTPVRRASGLPGQVRPVGGGVGGGGGGGFTGGALNWTLLPPEALVSSTTCALPLSVANSGSVPAKKLDARVCSKSKPTTITT